LQPFNFSGVSATDIEFWRGERRVLANVSFTLSRGECLHVVGPNGSGKTTLLRVVAGLLEPEQGRVEWSGRPTREHRDAWCASFSYLAHSDGLKPELTARENLAFETGLRRRAVDSELDEALARVGLGAVSDHPAGILSAGQRRRLALARVMLAAAPLWILDEPYTNLDSGGALLVSGAIARHLDAGGAALVAAHQPPAIPDHLPRRLELA
jgi:heme exporter protein A